MPSFEFGAEGIRKNTNGAIIKHSKTSLDKILKSHKSDKKTELSERDSTKHIEIAKKAELAAAKLTNVDQQITILSKAMESLPLFLKTPSADQIRFSLLVRRGFANLKNKALISAKRDAQEANKIRARHHDVVLLMANIYERAGKRDLAKQCFLSAVKYLVSAREGVLTARDEKRIAEWKSKASRLDWVDPFGPLSPLHNDVVLEILGHLDFRSRTLCMKVCRAWRMLFHASQLWYHLDFAPHRQGVDQIIANISFRSVDSALALANGQVRTLILPRIDWPTRHLSMMLGRLVQRNTVNLRVLDLDLADLDEAHLNVAMSHIGNFADLRVLHVAIASHFSTAVGSFPALEELNLLLIIPFSTSNIASVQGNVLCIGRLPSCLKKLHVSAEDHEDNKYIIPELKWSSGPSSLLDIKFENFYADNSVSMSKLNRLLYDATSLQKFSYIGGIFDGVLIPFPPSVVELDLRPNRIISLEDPNETWSAARLPLLEKLTVNGGSHRIPSILAMRIFHVLVETAKTHDIPFKDLTILNTWTNIGFHTAINNLLKVVAPDLTQLSLSYDHIEGSKSPWTTYSNLESLTLFDADVPGTQVAELIRGLSKLKLKHVRLEGASRLAENAEECKAFGLAHGVDLVLPKPPVGKNEKRVYH